MGWYDIDGEYVWKESGALHRFHIGKIYNKVDFMISVVVYGYGFTLII